QFTQGSKDASPRWSPDGSALAFTRQDENEKAQVWVMPAAGGEGRPVTSATGGVAEYCWSPDGDRIAFTAVINLDEETDESGSTKEEPSKEEERRPIEVRRGLFKSDGQRLLGGRRRHLFIVSLDDPEPTRLTEGDFNVAFPSWSPDGSEIGFVTAMHEDRDLDLVFHLFAVEAAGGSPRQITDWQGSVAAPVWAPDGGSIVFAGRTRPRSDRHNRLFRVDAKGGVPAEIAPEFDRNVMVGAPGYPGAPPRVTGDGALIFCARDGGCTHAYTLPLEGRAPRKIVGGRSRVVGGLSLAREANQIAFLASSSDFPGDISVAAANGEDESRLGTLNYEALDEIDVPLPQSRVFKAPDGKQLEGWVLFGSSDEPAPRPLLLDIHGGPHNAYGPTFPSTYLYRLVLAAQGWNVVFINSRGSDGYGEEFFGALTGGWGENDLGDFMSAVDALVAEGVADPDRMAVTGYSYGGFMTNWIVSHTDRFAAAVTGGCVTNLTSHYGTSDFGPFLAWEIGGDVYENRERYADLSPINHVEKVTTPVLILHGESDDRCPVAEAEQWFVALRRQRKKVEMVLYPGASHLFIVQGPPSQRLDYSRRLVEWVTRFAAGKPSEAE
ncbi:MAG: S9 family peptidase, partial [Actinomycetota bacterium]